MSNHGDLSYNELAESIRRKLPTTVDKINLVRASVTIGIPKSEVPEDAEDIFSLASPDEWEFSDFVGGRGVGDEEWVYLRFER